MPTLTETDLRLWCLPETLDDATRYRPGNGTGLTCQAWRRDGSWWAGSLHSRPDRVRSLRWTGAGWTAGLSRGACLARIRFLTASLA